MLSWVLVKLWAGVLKSFYGPDAEFFSGASRFGAACYISHIVQSWPGHSKDWSGPIWHRNLDRERGGGRAKGEGCYIVYIEVSFNQEWIYKPLGLLP